MQGIQTFSRRKKKAAFKMSFKWLFALLVGAFILSMAIWGIVKMKDTAEMQINAQTGQGVGILLDPLQAGYETSSLNHFTMPKETRIYNSCNNREKFGNQIIKISQRSMGNWTNTDIDKRFPNKYIFSPSMIQGKKFYVFSKPLRFPSEETPGKLFKVETLMYIVPESKKYCFLGKVPKNIKEEVGTYGLNNSDVFSTNCSLGELDKNYTKNVCFSPNTCEITVYPQGNYVMKNGNKLHYKGDSLMYAAIFADKREYECQLKRLMKKISILSKIYKNKASFVSSRGCKTNLQQDLQKLKSRTKNYANSDSYSANLRSIYEGAIKPVIRKNNLANCRLW